MTRLIADICKKWSPGPSISVRSQYFIFLHFSERGKYDSSIDCCINVLPGDERWGVLCFYVIRLTSSWEWALCSAPSSPAVSGCMWWALRTLVLLCVLFVSRYHPRHFIDKGILVFFCQLSCIKFEKKPFVDCDRRLAVKLYHEDQVFYWLQLLMNDLSYFSATHFFMAKNGLQLHINTYITVHFTLTIMPC